jgi:hypothetical protein
MPLDLPPRSIPDVAWVTSVHSNEPYALVGLFCKGANKDLNRLKSKAKSAYLRSFDGPREAGQLSLFVMFDDAPQHLSFDIVQQILKGGFGPLKTEILTLAPEHLRKSAREQTDLTRAVEPHEISEFNK